MLGIRKVVAPDTTSMPGKVCATVYLSGDILKVMHNACYNIEKKAKKHEIDTILAVAEEALDPSENIIQILVEIARQYKLRLHIRVLKKVVKEEKTVKVNRLDEMTRQSLKDLHGLSNAEIDKMQKDIVDKVKEEDKKT